MAKISTCFKLQNFAIGWLKNRCNLQKALCSCILFFLNFKTSFISIFRNIFTFLRKAACNEGQKETRADTGTWWCGRTWVSEVRIHGDCNWPLVSQSCVTISHGFWTFDYPYHPWDDCIFTLYIYHQSQPNVGKYTIHRWSWMVWAMAYGDVFLWKWCNVQVESLWGWWHEKTLPFFLDLFQVNFLKLNHPSGIFWTLRFPNRLKHIFCAQSEAFSLPHTWDESKGGHQKIR